MRKINNFRRLQKIRCKNKGRFSYGNGQMIKFQKKSTNTITCNHSTTSNPSSLTANNLPLKTLTSARSDDKALTNFSTVGGWITKTIMPENSFGGNIDLLRKSESRETNTNDLSFASEANLPLLTPLAAYSAENLFDLRNSLISILMFSSSRNLGIFASSDKSGGVLQSVPNHFFGQARVASNYPFDTFPCSNQFDD